MERFQKQRERLQLIVLDELGYVSFSKTGAELLFEVVSRAYERTSLIVTTNLPFEDWTEVMGTERLTGALLDRLTHRIHILEANGESYRIHESNDRLVIAVFANKLITYSQLSPASSHYLLRKSY